MADFRMPALGADMEAGTLVAWRRKPGERLERGDVIAEVETDKGVIEVEVFEPGVLQRYLVEPGQRVPVGTPLAVLSDASAGAMSADAPQVSVQTPAVRVGELTALAPAAASPASAPTEAARARELQAPAPATASPAPGPTAARARERQAPPPKAAELAARPAQPPLGSAPAELPLTPSLRRRARELGVAPSTLLARALHLEPAVSPAPGQAVSEQTSPERVEVEWARSSPAARRRAAQLGIDLAAVSGSGPGGAVVLRDVERLAGAERMRTAVQEAQEGVPVGAAASRLPPAAATAARPEAASRLRRAIGAAMARSKREIPHYYLSTTIDFARAGGWLARRNLETGVQERIVPAALLLKAVARAARKLPEFNAVWRDGLLQQMASVNLGVAVALRGGGLIAPAIHDADRLELPQLMQRLSDLVRRARSGALRSSELSDGTLTVTSLGERGVEAVFPIIYAPQTAIVGFGKISERPWVVDSTVQARPLVTASLAADHRVTDGHLGARFLNEIDSLLQEPELL